MCVNSFILPANFVFGMVGPAQGNTRGASLLGFHPSLSQYSVNTVLLTRAAVTLSVGSAVPSTPVVMRGLRMLWFVIGKFYSDLNSLSLFLT